MSKIAITSAQTAPAVAFSVQLKSIVGQALSDLRVALASGAPFFEQELFLNNHSNIAQQIRSIGALAAQHGVRLNYYELQPGEDFMTIPLEECRVNAEIVENILREWEKREM